MATLALTMILAGCAATSASISPTSAPAPSPSSPPTPRPTASAAPIESATAVPQPAIGWRQVFRSDPIAGGLVDIAWTGSRFVAIGWNGVLDSTDGITWNRQATEMHDVRLTQLAAGPDGIVAIGTTDDQTVSWTSADGLTWTSQVDPFGGFDVNDVSAADEGWLAVGSEMVECGIDCGYPARSIVWTSTDGLAWTPVAAQPSLRGGAMHAVTQGGPGYVAVGYAADRASGGTVAAVWVSADSEVWSRVPDSPQLHHPYDADPPSSAFMNDVIAAGGEIAALGVLGSKLDGGAAPAAWWSPDGSDWSLVADRPHEDEIDNSFEPIVAVPDGFFAIEPSGGGGCPGDIWSSVDGTLYDMLTVGQQRDVSCNPTDPPTGFWAVAAAASPHALVAINHSGIWVHDIP